MSATTKTPPAPVTISINGRPFSFVEKVVGGNAKAEVKGKPYLHLVAPDWSALTSFVVAAGQGPLLATTLRSVNSVVADGTMDAFTKSPDGKYTLDPAAAVKGILDAIAESIRTGNDEIKEKLAGYRAEQDELWAQVMKLAAAKQPLPDSLVNKGLQLQVNIGQLEAKLVSKKRAPKAAAATPAPTAK